MVMTKDVLFSLTKGGYAPQEEMLEVARKKGKLYINFTILYPDLKLNDEQISNIKDIFEKCKI